MKPFIWTLFAAAALLWTLVAWIGASLIEFTLPLLASEPVLSSGRAVTELPVPSWLAVWIDPAWLRAAQGGLAWALEALQGAGPGLQSAARVLVPVVWIAWGVGLALMAVAALVFHQISGRSAHPARPAGA